MNRVILWVILSLICGCSWDSNPVGAIGGGGLFEIYFTKDSTLTGYQASRLGIDQLILSDEPWLAEDGIEFYDFSSHFIYLKRNKGRYFEGYDSSSAIRTMFRPRAFVVVAGGKRFYIGSVHSVVLSSAPWGPYIDEMSVWYYPADVLHIARSWMDTVDVRNDSRVKDVLNSLGLYHGGISVELESVSVVDNSDTASVAYTFRIVNKDRDNLLVPDPDRMGTALFHYFTNGVVFQSGNAWVQSLYKQTLQPSVDWDQTWLTEVPVNGSIMRTVQLKGYPRIMPGTYTCTFTFASPGRIQKADRSQPGGRIWLGDIRTEEIAVVVP